MMSTHPHNSASHSSSHVCLLPPESPSLPPAIQLCLDTVPVLGISQVSKPSLFHIFRSLSIAMRSLQVPQELIACILSSISDSSTWQMSPSRSSQGLDTAMAVGSQL